MKRPREQDRKPHTTTQDTRRDRHRFRPYERLRKKVEFDRVFAARCRAADVLMTLHVAPNGLDYTRLGISVGRHVGGAVVRNRIRRRLRDAFRLNKQDLPRGFDLVCVARKVAAIEGSDLTGSLIRLANRAVSRSRPSR